MFTGIVKAKGKIAALGKSAGDVRLRVQCTDLPFMTYAVGDSIAVNGVCLTAVELSEDGFETDVSTETLEVTALGGLGVGAPVNLEPALSLGERLGGHLVSGHVDCVGRVCSRSSDARSIRLQIELPEEYARYVAKKGSICVDGDSPGTVVNIEVDMLARYVERLMAAGDGGLTMDFLRAHGYV